MQAKCVYCEWAGNSQGLKSHVRMGHPDHYARWQFDHVNATGVGKGKIRKELLLPETMQETTWHRRLNYTQTHHDAKNLVLEDANMEPMPKEKREMKEAEEPLPPNPSHKYQCSNCGHCFTDPAWEKGDAFCPNCEERLDIEDLDDE